MLAQEDWWKHLLEIAFHIHPEDATQYDKEMIVDICKEYGKNIVIKTCWGAACSCYCCNLEGFVKWRLYMIIILFVVHLVDLADVNNNTINKYLI